MNLQFRSLRAHIKSGADYDDENPIVRNVVYDITAAKRIVDHQIVRDVLKRETLTKEIKSYRTKPIDVDTYMRIIDRISHRLFDEFAVSKITSERQAEWKEYFHMLYDLVVVDYTEVTDKTTRAILINETYKYWNFLPRPKSLKPTNKLYALVGSIQDLFNDLRTEHDKYVDPYFIENIENRYDENVKNRQECVRLGNTISENEKTLQVYDEILQWSIK